jgi:hypothetical protein
MLASSVVRVHLAADVPCSRARRPLQAARADVYAAALANACRTWKLRSAREPTGLRPLGMPVYWLRRLHTRRRSTPLSGHPCSARFRFEAEALARIWVVGTVASDELQQRRALASRVPLPHEASAPAVPRRLPACGSCYESSTSDQRELVDAPEGLRPRPPAAGEVPPPATAWSSA